MQGVRRRLTDLLVFVGPSGCGKSTIIKKLQADLPDVFGFSTSHTTRAPRTGEVDGREYHFVTRPKFEAMVAKGEFMEYTELSTSAGDGHHGNIDRTLNYYGTSTQALNEVLLRNKVVLMDTDVLGAINIRRYCEDKLTPVAPVRAKLSHSAQESASPSSSAAAAAAAELPSWDRDRVKQKRQDSDSDTGSVHHLTCKVVFIAPPSMDELARRLRARKSESEDTLQQRLRLGEQWMTWADANVGFFDHRFVNDDLEVCYAAVRKMVLSEVVIIESSL